MSFSWEGKKVSVTGGAGFIGSNLAIRLCQEGAEVTVVDSLSPHAGGNPANLKGFEDRLSFVQEELNESSGVEEAVIGKDVIFHCAALSSHGGSMRHPLGNLDANCSVTLRLLEAIRKENPLCKIVLVGTTTQIGRMLYDPADELHPEFPLDIYSANKCAAEKYALIYASAYGVRSTVVRLPNVYGERAAIHSPNFTFNNFFLGLALQGLPITLYGKGDQMRNFLYVGDAVDALLVAAAKECSMGNVYLAVSDEHYSVRQISDAIVEACGKGEVTEIEWPEGRESMEVGDARFTNEKIKEELEWNPKMSLSEGLEKTCEFFRDRFDDYLTLK